MTPKKLDTFALARDLPEHGLRRGDLGTVVHVHSTDVVEVEFVTATGRTRHVLTLPIDALRPLRDDDLLAVRPGTEPH